MEEKKRQQQPRQQQNPTHLCPCPSPYRCIAQPVSLYISATHNSRNYNSIANKVRAFIAVSEVVVCFVPFLYKTFLLFSTKNKTCFSKRNETYTHFASCTNW